MMNFSKLIRSLKRPWKTAFLVSLLINLLFCGFLSVKTIKKLQNMNGGGYNEQYEPYVSMFQLNDKDVKTDAVFLGDSITARGRWEEFFPDDISVLNRGIGSDTTAGILNRLDEIERRNPDMIFIMVGINDLAHGVSDDAIGSNMREIVRELSGALPECAIILESTLPATMIKEERVQAVNDIYRRIAADNAQCRYLDLYQLFHNEDGSIREELLSSDGVHLNGSGYRVMIDAQLQFMK